MYNIRVEKIAKSLTKRYSTLILGWNREGVPKNKVDNYTVKLKLFGMRAPMGKPSLVPYFPLFWFWILFNLFVIRPQVVHACQLDTVLPGYIYKLIFRKKLVFDVFDRYAMVNIPKKYLILYSVVNLLEELFCKKTDVLITVSEKLINSFKSLPKNYAIIFNCPEENYANTTASPCNNSGKNVLIIVYAGVIVRHRGLENIAAAIKSLDNVELVTAGRVYHKEVLDQILTLPNVKYNGILLPNDALSLERHADAMFALYDLRIPINNFAKPNKMFEAMMFGVPLITNLAPEFVSDVGFGIVVDYDDINEIKSAIVSLRDNVRLRNCLGKNGRRAFTEKYNWSQMEQKLYGIYGNLLKYGKHN
jgi:glycosyltransferase involved in cell wall biosynthesis